MNGAVEIAPVDNKSLLLSTIKTAMDNKTISGLEIYQFLASNCGCGATEDQRGAVSNYHDLDDNCEVDESAWVSESDTGYWVHAWLWVPGDKDEATADEASNHILRIPAEG